jgi:hypothetical protein
MDSELTVLLLTAISISFLHTLAGPDHYLPFLALSRSRRWSVRKTLGWTILCGCGHVWSSVFLGLLGAAIGWSLSSLQWLQSVRGGIAGWTLVGFGFVYAVWGFMRVKQQRRHRHFGEDEKGALFVFEHRHGEQVLPAEKHKLTPWVMFLVFLFGPCEPMIPLLYFPAARNSLQAMALLIGVYTACTLAAMVLMVLLGYYGLGFFKLQKLEKYMHALGGLTVLVCGLGMVWLGW